MPKNKIKISNLFELVLNRICLNPVNVKTYISLGKDPNFKTCLPKCVEFCLILEIYQ